MMKFLERKGSVVPKFLFATANLMMAKVLLGEIFHLLTVSEVEIRAMITVYLVK